MPRSFAVVFVLASLSAGASAQVAYAGRAVTIEAGVLILDSQLDNNVLDNPAPFIWSNMDLDRSVKPASWTFRNPLGATTLTQTAYDRWRTLSQVRGGFVPAVGSRLTKRDAPYWEVRLAGTTDEALANFDVLSVTLRGPAVDLSPKERERLRRFVDQGGVLWVDVQTSANNNDIVNNFPLPFRIDVSGATLTADFAHPMLNSTEAVTFDDLTILQSLWLGDLNIVRPVRTGDFAGLGPIQSWVTADSLKLQPVVGNSDGSTVAAGRIGDGAVVVTTRSIGRTINRGFLNGAVDVDNFRFRASEPLQDGASTAAIKLVVNALSLPSGYPSPGGGSRKSSSTSVDLTAPLMRRFSGTLGSGESFDPAKPPAIFKDRVVAVFNTAGGSRVVVADKAPGNDLDGDGNPDDGVVDTLDSSLDVIWQSQDLPAIGSAPTCAEIADSQVVNGGRTVTDVVLVTLANGSVAAFDLRSAPSRTVAPLRVIAPPDATSPASPPLAPTVHEGVAYVADTRQQDDSGRVWMIDLKRLEALASAGPFAVFGSPRFRAPSAPPTVGYIPIFDNSGGVDKVVYVAVQRADNNRPAGIASLWVGARGERPIRTEPQGQNLVVETRALLQSLPLVIAADSPYGVKVSVVKRGPAGEELPVPFEADAPLFPLGVRDIFTGTISQGGAPGSLNLGLTAAGATLNWDGILPNGDPYFVRVDYTIDWGQTSGIGATSGDLYVRGHLELPDTAATGRRIIGNLALAPGGAVFAVTANPSAAAEGGTLFAFREEGRGEFKCAYRWDLFNEFTYRFNAGGGQNNQFQVPPAVVDEDDLVKRFFLTFLDKPILDPTFTSGPTVAGDTVYVNARGQKQIFGPIRTEVAVLMAFESNPQPVEFYVENLQPGFAILQPDFARSSNKSVPETFSVLQGGQYTFEQDLGSTLSRIRLPNTMAVTRGRVRDSLSMTLPIIIRRGGQSDILVEPELGAGNGQFVPGLARGRWSPLRWYTIFQGLDPRGGPVVNGQTLFVGGSSRFPDLLRNGFNGIPQPNGLLYGMDAEIASNDPFLRANSVRPWTSQLHQLIVNARNPSGLQSNPAIRWPQPFGVNDAENGSEAFETFRIRLLQNTLPEPRAEGVAAGDGTLVAYGTRGFYAFSRADFTVADEGRAGRFDSNGNPLWTTDFSVNAGGSVPVGNVRVNKSISQPNRIYAAGPNSYWVVDTGADRVVKLDSGGRELRVIAEMKPHPRFVPGGFRQGEPLKLNQPRDVFVYTTRQTQASANRVWGDATTDELWLHYVIADSGNFRIVELVDRYAIDPNSGRVVGVVQYVDPSSQKPGGLERAVGLLYWHTPAELSGKQYAYNSIERVFVPGTGFSNVAVFAFGFGNAEPGKSSFGLDSNTGGNNRQPDVDRTGGNGGVVLLNQGQTKVITEFELPGSAANVFYNEASGRFDAPARPRSTRKIAGLSSVTMRYTANQLGQPVLAIMIADNSGVYELVPDPLLTDRWLARYAVPNEVYTVIRRRRSDDALLPNNPLGLRAAFARRLDSGEVVVVNNYFGRRRPSGNGTSLPFTGEILMLDGSFAQTPTDRGFGWNQKNLGFDSLSIKYELPPVQGARGIVSPVFADRR